MISTILLTVMAFLSGCASTRGYFADRGRDTLDVVTVTAGTGAGAQARFGPFPFGLLRATDVTGLRYGSVFYRTPATIENEEINTKMLAVLAPILAIVAPLNEKGFETLFAWEHHDHFPLNDIQLSRNKQTGNRQLPNTTHIEVIVGFGASLRIGFNPGELLDFLLGWTTIDLFNDDIEWKTVRSNQRLEPTPDGAAPP